MGAVEEQAIRRVLDELDAVRGRVEFLEKAEPKNALRLKPSDGHHHMEPVRVREDGTDKGFVFEEDFIGASVVREAWPNNRRATIRIRGGAPFCFDYFIMAAWANEVAAGRGTEGQTINDGFGGSFLVYSEPLAAAVHAKANRTTAGQGTTFLVCGEHTLTGTLEMATGGNTQVHRWLGTSPGSSKLITDGSNTVVTVNAEGAGSGVDPIFYIDNLLIDTASAAVSGISIEHAAAARISNCRFDIGHASAVGLTVQGLDANNVDVRDCHFVGSLGTAVDLDNAAGFFKFKGNQIQALPTGITITNSGELEIVDNVFYQVTTAAMTFVGNSFETNVVISNNRIALGATSVGIGFLAGLNTTSDLTITGNTFSSIGDNSVGIDFSTLNASGLCFGITIIGNTFACEGQSATAYAIDGPGADYVRNSIIMGNVFRDCAAGNEYRNWGNGTGNEAMHNIAMDDDGAITQIAVADVGSPVGHTTSPISGIGLDPDVELTIDTNGDITVTQSHHTIDTFEDAASDDLDTINGLVANQLYFFYPADGARTVVFKHGVDNILCIGNADIALEDAHDFMWGFSPDGSTIYVAPHHAETHTVHSHSDVVASTPPNKGSILAGTGSFWDDEGVGADRKVLEAYSSATRGLTWRTHEHLVSITVPNPTASENIGISHFFSALTIQELQAWIVGGTSVTIDLKHGADRSAAGASVLDDPEVITDKTTGENFGTGVFDDYTLAADEHLWLVTSAVVGTVTELHVTARFTYD